jgi:hypothetical protein
VSEFDGKFEHHTIATEFPNGCVFCVQNVGPLASGREHPGFGKLYICASCWNKAGVALGTLKGDQQKVVLDNTKELAQERAEHEKTRSRLKKSETHDKEGWTLADERAVALEWARQRIEQLESVVQAEADAKLAVLGAK